MTMAPFIRLVLLLLLTGTPVFAKRLKVGVSSQAAIAEDPQPHRSHEAGCPAGGCPSARPGDETRKKKQHIVANVLKVVKGAAKAAAVVGAWEVVKRLGNKAHARHTSTREQEVDLYESESESDEQTSESESSAAVEEPKQELKAQPTSPTSSEEEVEAPASSTPTFAEEAELKLEAWPASPTLSEDDPQAPLDSTAAELAFAKWAAHAKRASASPVTATAGEPEEESEESPAKDAAEEITKDPEYKTKSSATLSSAPLFPAFFATDTGLEARQTK